jgi:hypothetical protein
MEEGERDGEKSVREIKSIVYTQIAERATERKRERGKRKRVNCILY